MGAVRGEAAMVPAHLLLCTHSADCAHPESFKSCPHPSPSGLKWRICRCPAVSEPTPSCLLWPQRVPGLSPSAPTLTHPNPVPNSGCQVLVGDVAHLLVPSCLEAPCAGPALAAARPPSLSSALCAPSCGHVARFFLHERPGRRVSLLGLSGRPGLVAACWGQHPGTSTAAAGAEARACGARAASAGQAAGRCRTAAVQVGSGDGSAGGRHSSCTWHTSMKLCLLRAPTSKSITGSSELRS